MKCYYQVDDEEWRKGEVCSIDGGTAISFTSREKKKLVHELTVRHPETLVGSGDKIHITGYTQREQHPAFAPTYKLVGVDVVFNKRYAVNGV